MKKMLHKNAIKYVKQEYTLIFIYYVIRFGIIRFEYLSFGIWYFIRFGPPLKKFNSGRGPGRIRNRKWK